MICQTCAHLFSQDDVEIKWFQFGLIIEVNCPICETILQTQISSLQKPVKKEGK